MKKLMFALTAAAAVLSMSAFSEEAAKGTSRRRDVKKMLEGQMRRFGGMIPDVRQQKGKVVIVNTQSAANEEWFKSTIKQALWNINISVGYEKGKFNLAKPELIGEATLFIVDDPALPMSLVAPEAHWAMANVTPLKTDNAKFFEMRVKKEVARTFAMLLGACNSQYQLSLMGCATTPEQIDRFIDDKLPVDVLARLTGYMAGYGITPYKMVKYRDAASQGWAPQPTNEFQKAIWDQIHSLPEKPIQIKFDPKRDK